MIITTMAINSKTLPFEPTEKMTSGFAATLCFWLDCNFRQSPKELFICLKELGIEPPEWLTDCFPDKEDDMRIYPKHMVKLIYKAMWHDFE